MRAVQRRQEGGRGAGVPDSAQGPGGDDPYVGVGILQQWQEAFDGRLMTQLAQRLRSEGATGASRPFEVRHGALGQAAPLEEFDEGVGGLPGHLAEIGVGDRLEDGPAAVVQLDEPAEDPFPVLLFCAQQLKQLRSAGRGSPVRSDAPGLVADAEGHQGDQQHGACCQEHDGGEAERSEAGHRESLASTASTRLVSSRGLKGLTM